MNEITELQGSIGYTISAFFCLYLTIKVWDRNSNRNSRWAWFSFFLITSLFAFEIQLSFRFLIKPYLLEILLFFTTYEQRYSVQVILITVFSASLASCLYRLIVAEKIRLSIKLALTGSVFSILLFALAAISLHSVDALFYAPLLNVYAVCWLWNLGALLIVTGVYIEIRANSLYAP
jgi:hypothetical protein